MIPAELPVTISAFHMLCDRLSNIETSLEKVAASQSALEKNMLHDERRKTNTWLNHELLGLPLPTYIHKENRSAIKWGSPPNVWFPEACVIEVKVGCYLPDGVSCDMSKLDEDREVFDRVYGGGDILSADQLECLWERGSLLVHPLDSGRFDDDRLQVIDLKMQEHAQGKLKPYLIHEAYDVSMAFMGDPKEPASRSLEEYIKLALDLVLLTGHDGRCPRRVLIHPCTTKALEFFLQRQRVRYAESYAVYDTERVVLEDMMVRTEDAEVLWEYLESHTFLSSYLQGEMIPSTTFTPPGPP